ncbi:transcription antitermination factor NusB [Patescibacteria group bacterium]|nr:transcription antitermination factor NusB [Patescibacteria group bacterium]
MAQRHLARTIALQVITEWDFHKSILKSTIDIKVISKRNLQEFAPKKFEGEKFSKNLIKGVMDNLKKIDAYIKKYAPQWPVEQITLIDRNILRIGIFELIFFTETPPKVAINESIEIAKTFGGITSSKFINGVLGAIYEDLKNKDEKNN